MKRTLCTTIVCALALCAAVKATARPNLLLIVTDDESWFEHGIYGHSNLKTPHFDRLARDLHISDNSIEYKYADAIRLINVNGAVIKDNTIAAAPDADPGKKAIRLTRCDGIEQVGNK